MSDAEQTQAKAATVGLDVELRELVRRIEEAPDAATVDVDRDLLKMIVRIAVEGMDLTSALARAINEVELEANVPRSQLLGVNTTLALSELKGKMLSSFGPNLARAGLNRSQGRRGARFADALAQDDRLADPPGPWTGPHADQEAIRECASREG